MNAALRLEDAVMAAVPAHPFPGTALAALIVVLLMTIGLLGWLLRYVTSTLIPAQRDAFLQCLKEEREEHKAALNLVLAAHKELVTALLARLEDKQS